MIIKLNLQLFSDGEKTEKATPKKRKEAREEGQVLQSREIAASFMLLVSFLTLSVFGNYMLKNITNFMRQTFSIINDLDPYFTFDSIRLNFFTVISVFLSIIAPVALVTVIAGLVINYLQIGFLFTTKTLKPKLSRINPVEGFKRLFSKRAIMELIKSIIKIIIIGYVGYSYIKKRAGILLKLPNMGINQLIKNFSELSFGFSMKIIGALFFISIIDYIYQWREYEKNLMMTKQELKEEYKQMEGDPLVKSKIREKQRKMAFSRMMQEVPKADVIITNPTHIAVALKYDRENSSAPYLVAKGVDLIAENIKKVARENKIPIVENKPLARAINEVVEIGEVIPEELYEAVAEVLAYVYSLKDEI
ncbi:flagellar biosynthesis protein FlhB [Anaerosalibacter sp. Marseille-P3206]|uniref:flagellar biosynthesis protein FlhB n=1 Tax=Anaerosalibacter sp. Marseille-P3206 TaxID=1871005 RepID=UPI000987A3EF|nr:flagellar biosynthesis protein FlhB [Anaerosalibacter sp. Marseille-P3206]